MRFRRYAAAIAASAILHALLVASAIWLTLPRATSVERAMPVFVAAPIDDPKHPGLRRVDGREGRQHATRVGVKPLRLAQVRIDVKKIAERADLLFPALTPGLAIDSLFPNDGRLALQWQPLEQRSSSKAPGAPLVLDRRAVQSVVDRSWARRDRWKAFEGIRTLLETHLPGGSLSDILQAYREQDALQPYTDRDTRDPRLWTQLSLAADHVSFIGLIRMYASSHPGTPEAIELLLLLDTIVQAEEDALRVLLETEPATDLQSTEAANADAYTLLVHIRDEYRRELTRRGLTSPTEISAYYDRVRLAILARVVDVAGKGYGGNDARFLIGSIQWRAGHRRKAVAAWSGLTARSDGAYAASCAALRSTLGSGVDAPAIDRILKIENGRWLSRSYDRLRHFGYRFDTY